MLEPVPGLDFDPVSHRYRFKGRWLHTSPTGVLSVGQDANAKKRIQETKHIWEPRGNHVHQWLENFLTGAAELDHGDYGAWIEPLRDCWLWKNCTVLASELRLVDEKRNMGGSVDFLIKTDRTGTTTVGDLKTVQTVEALKRREPADAQLGSYVRMLNFCYPHIFIERAVTVIAAPGECKVVTSDVNSCSVAWEDAWARYQMQQEMLGF